MLPKVKECGSQGCGQWPEVRGGGALRDEILKLGIGNGAKEREQE